MLKQEILDCLKILNDRLASRGEKGEICLYGGAVMCLLYDARPSTKDVDAVFHPSKIIREIAKEMADELDLADGWLNDGVKGFLVEHPKKVYLNMPNLTVMAADADYMLAMKTLASRVDGTDKKDIQFLTKTLNLTSPEDVFDVIEKYYPRRLIKPATQFFLEELFDEIQDG